MTTALIIFLMFIALAATWISGMVFTIGEHVKMVLLLLVGVFFLGGAWIVIYGPTNENAQKKGIIEGQQQVLQTTFERLVVSGKFSELQKAFPNAKIVEKHLSNENQYIVLEDFGLKFKINVPMEIFLQTSLGKTPQPTTQPLPELNP